MVHQSLAIALAYVAGAVHFLMLVIKEKGICVAYSWTHLTTLMLSYQFLVSYLNGQISVVIGERVPTWTSSTSFRFILLQVLYTSYYWHVKWICDVFHLTHPTSLMLLCQFLVCEMQLRLILILWINLSIGAMAKSLKLKGPKWMEQVGLHCCILEVLPRASIEIIRFIWRLLLQFAFSALPESLFNFGFNRTSH